MSREGEVRVMRIPPETIRDLVNLYTNRADRAGSAATTRAGTGPYAAARNDRADFSDTVKLLRTLREHVKDLPEVDEARVNQIKQKLASGTYEVDPRAVAASILAELGGSTP
jgi:negative regulator of flagellin synthesis FlgM